MSDMAVGKRLVDLYLSKDPSCHTTVACSRDITVLFLLCYAHMNGECDKVRFVYIDEDGSPWFICMSLKDRGRRFKTHLLEPVPESNNRKLLNMDDHYDGDPYGYYLDLLFDLVSSDRK
jgi:hypothetical protein